MDKGKSIWPFRINDLDIITIKHDPDIQSFLMLIAYQKDKSSFEIWTWTQNFNHVIQMENEGQIEIINQ